MKFIIYSPKESTEDKAVFWTANNSGYTEFLVNAGIYDEKEVLEREQYYNDGITSIAIPLTAEALAKIGLRVVIDTKAVKQFLRKR